MARTPVRSAARNPLAFDPGREQRVRERAYHLWETDGKPHGRDVEYWERARELIGMEESAGSGLLPNPQTEPNSPRETGIEEADIQENLGEFPGLQTDQGEVKMTPTRKTTSIPTPTATPAAKRKTRARPKKPA
jgi:hypothetical protein